MVHHRQVASVWIAFCGYCDLTVLMMKYHRKSIIGIVAAVVFATFSASALAATIQISFTGLDVVYDGSAIYDGGSTAGGLADPADADPLSTVDFFVDGTLVGSLSSDISLDAFIPDITGISAAASTVDVQTTPGNPGFFDLLIGTSPLASEFLLIDLEEVTFTYIDVLNIVQFTFGAAVSDVFAQNLPFDLVIGDPLTVSFSAQVVAGTKTDNGTDITGFEAAGTGDIGGPAVPEPTAALLLALGTLATVTLGRRGL
jgi:hypothetical protein